jgi:hypothetical protein
MTFALLFWSGALHSRDLRAGTVKPEDIALREPNWPKRTTQIYDRIEYDVLNRLYRQYLPQMPPARTVWSVQIEAGFKVQLDVVAAA